MITLDQAKVVKEAVAALFAELSEHEHIQPDEGRVIAEALEPHLDGLLDVLKLHIYLAPEIDQLVKDGVFDHSTMTGALYSTMLAYKQLQMGLQKVVGAALIGKIGTITQNAVTYLERGQ